MTKFYWAMAALLLCFGCVAQAQTMFVVHTLKVENPGWFGSETTLTFDATQPVAVRAFTVPDPMRVIIDFPATAIDPGISEAALGAELVTSARAGWFSADVGRLVLDLAEPAKVSLVQIEDTGNGGRIFVMLESISASDFSALPPPPTDWARTPYIPRARTGGTLLIALDPGHGGIDPGAIREGLAEKDIALSFAQDLATRLSSIPGIDVALTREADTYVGLRERVRRARGMQADLMISIHANTVTEGVARGTALYTLSDTASDAAAAELAARENAAELFDDPSLGAEEDVSLVLLDLARRETDVRSDALARALVESLRSSVGVIRSRPHRAGDFAVLKAPDVPSVLLELGFLSDLDDRANMTDPAWRARAAEGVAAGIQAWIATDPRLETVSLRD